MSSHEAQISLFLRVFLVLSLSPHFSLSLSLSLSHTHTHTHTHTTDVQARHCITLRKTESTSSKTSHLN